MAARVVKEPFGMQQADQSLKGPAPQDQRQEPETDRRPQRSCPPPPASGWVQKALPVDEATRKSSDPDIDEAASLAHDLRGAIAVIAENAVLLEQTKDERARKACVDRITRTCSTMSTFIEHTLEQHCLQSGKLLSQPQAVPVETTLQACLALQALPAQAKQIQLRLALEGTTPRVFADPILLQRALNNLLENAIKFAYPETTVTIAVQRCSQRWVIAIHDQGPQISPAELLSLFAPFRRGRKAHKEGQGFGLGLSIAKRLVELQGGTLQAASTPAGVTFRIALPAC